jgi:phospholipid/cholesterol/gamma-HCH transport system substrate-binding protein
VARNDRLILEIRRAAVPFALLIVLGICGAIAAWVIFKNQSYQRPWASYYDVKAQLDDAKGLVPGKQEVRISGVKVGVVTKSELVNGKPVVTMSIQSKYAPLYKDATLVVRPLTPLQDMFINIDRGTPATGKVPENGTLLANASVTPVDISRVLQVFDEDTRTRLSTLLRQMSPALDDNGAELQRSFVALAPFLTEAKRLSTVLADRRVQLKRAVTNFGRLTTSLATRDRQLTTLVNNGENTLAELAQKSRPFNELLAALPGTLSALQGSMQTLAVAQKDLDPALTDLRPVAAKLEGSLNSLRQLGIDIQPAAKALQPAVNGLKPLARDLRPTAAALSTALGKLRGQADSYNTLTKELVPCESVIRDFFGNTPSVLKFSNTAGAYPRGDLSFDSDVAGGGKATNLRRTASCTDGSGKTGGRK